MIDYINDDLGGWTVGDTTYTLEPVAVDGQSDDTAVTSRCLVPGGCRRGFRGGNQ